jgi:hypothetical protein
MAYYVFAATPRRMPFGRPDTFVAINADIHVTKVNAVENHGIYWMVVRRIGAYKGCAPKHSIADGNAGGPLPPARRNCEE